MERSQFTSIQSSYNYCCVRPKYLILISLTVVVVIVCLGVGLGVSLSRTPTPPPPPPLDRGPCQPSDDRSGDWKDFRLPAYVWPVHYDLHLEPDLDRDTYGGTVEVHLELGRPTRHLWMHIRDTYVSAKPRLKKKLKDQQEVELDVKGCFEYRPNEYVVVEAELQLDATAPGEVYVLSLDFQGWLNGSVVGFYRVIYTEQGQTKKIAATDHEPTDARKSFPCFDEPNKKATYKISITHDAEYEALSNMPRELLPSGSVKTSFERSVSMSTYLVCFAVHQFTYEERTSASGIPLRIYAQPSQIHTAEYAAKTTKIIFDYFEEYFNMSYSISKLDMIAIPDFGTGAMENWGLITYRETNLLYDQLQSSSYNKQRVASVIAHELVHQWFGNIVTMDWWDDLWLNEGFASFFEYVGVERAEPDWSMRDIMLISDVLPVMVNDALLSSHPIIVNVSTPAEITSVFDAISYSKGASILRMLEDWMGKDQFKEGCRKYLKDYYFKNAKTSNFWASLANVCLNIYLFCTQFVVCFDFGNSSMFDPVDGTCLPGGPSVTVLMSLFRADIIDYGNAFNITQYLSKETEYIVWERLDSSTAYVQDMLSTNKPVYAKLQKLFGGQVKAIATQLGWDDVGTQTTRLLRETVLGLACQMGDTLALNEASHIFQDWIDGKLSHVAVNLRLLVYRYGMKNSGNATAWSVMFQRYMNTSLAQEKDKLLYGLASVENQDLLTQLLEATKDESVVRSQDLFTVVRYVSYNPVGRSLAWNWTTLNWNYLVERYTINDRNLGRLLNQITTSYNTESQLKMEFFSSTPDAGAGEMPRKQALETVRNNIQWVSRNQDEIRLWLDNNVSE
uniref:Aminopeptidase n=1 Tax=Sphaeramia orbicularis TaxID=375764 RepID=A0A673B8Z4_9TELE